MLICEQALTYYRGGITIRRGIDSKNKIIHEARELFAARGYKGASIAGIAAATNLSEGAIYRHFDSKEMLLFACIQPALEKSMEVFKSETTPKKNLYHFVRHNSEKLLKLFQEHYSAFKIIFTEAYIRTELIQMVLESIMVDERTSEETDRMLSFNEIRRLRNHIIIILSQVLALWGIFHLRTISGELSGFLPNKLQEISDQDLLDDMTAFYLYGVAGIAPESFK